MSKSLLDLMPEEDAKNVIDRAKRRIERNKAKKGLNVSPEIFLVAEMGYYFGWEAVMAIRRGYTVVPGTNNKEVFTLEEATVLLEGAKKVWYSKLIEQAHVGVVSNSFNSSSKSFDNAITPFVDKAEIKE
jgi:hypothetical protein